MNIFATSFCPKACAQALDDKRLVKMVLETAQLLSTAANMRGVSTTYKATHKNHPCSLWARENTGNYKWLYSHFDALCNEYYVRFKKEHSCAKLKGELFSAKHKLPFGLVTRHPNCAANKKFNLSFKSVEDVYEAYRLYLCERWKLDKRPPKWTNAKPPRWL